jgi:hypothetical protein
MKKIDGKTSITTTAERFFKLLNKAIQPLVPSDDEKAESQTSDDYTDKRTRQHKAEDAED